MKDSKPAPMMDVIAHAQRDRAIAILAELEAEPCRLNKLELIERLLPPSSAAAGSERDAFQFPEEFLQKLNELSDLLDKFRPGTGPAVALFCQDSYEKGWQAARAAAPPNDADYWKSRATTAELKVLTFTEEIAKLGAAAPPNERVFIGEVWDCPAQSVIEESCICKAGWGHRSFDVNYRAAAPAPPSETEQLLKQISDYRSGYSCGYSDAKNGTRMRDKDAACLFFGVTGVPDVAVADSWASAREDREALAAQTRECKHEFMPPLLNGNTSCIRCGKSENWNEKAAPAPWIPVSERLPESGEVRVKLRDGSELNNAIWQADGDWWWAQRFIDEAEVTHWQPLPAPPVADSRASAREEKA